ncbi:hypothetical protein Tco_1070672, partial [Tanacetum coccineum]
MAKRMASVFKSDLMVLPYAMLLTRLYRHVLTMEPRPTTDVHYLVNHFMIPLTEGRAHRFMVDGKRPYLQTSSGSLSSQSQTPNQGEIDPVDNFTLNPLCIVTNFHLFLEENRHSLSKQRGCSSVLVISSLISERRRSR